MYLPSPGLGKGWKGERLKVVPVGPFKEVVRRERRATLVNQPAHALVVCKQALIANPRGAFGGGGDLLQRGAFANFKKLFHKVFIEPLAGRDPARVDL